MVELTVLDTFLLGVGPSVDTGVFGVCQSDAGGTVGCAGFSGGFFGLDGRVALTLGSHGPGGDSGFSVSANVHPTFLGNGEFVMSATLGVGGEWF
jgi:hypothetical protein